MAKQEFLESLRLALNGKIRSGLIMENISFYENYINTEVRKGKSEEEVLTALGDPRLIAKTIIETNSKNNGQPADQDQSPERKKFLLRMPAWVWLVVVIVVVLLIISIVFSIISAVLPVLLPILLVLFLVKVFRDWVN